MRSTRAPAAGPRPLESETGVAAAGQHEGVAYIVPRFPKLSETFVLYELEALRELDVAVELFPLLRHREEVLHPESESWVRSARYSRYLSRELIGANLRALARAPRSYLGALLEIVRGTVGSRGMLLRAIAVFPKAVVIAEEAARLRVRHIHAHFATHAAVAALVVHRLTGIPFSFTAHGSDLHVDRHMLRAKVEASRFVVTISRYNHDMFVQECGAELAEKVHVVHCGVDTDVFRPATERTDGRPFAFAVVASLLDVKGHRFLIEACEMMKQRGLRFQCHLVGDGPLRGALEEQVSRAALDDRVVFHGNLPRQQVATVLSRMDAAALTSVLTSRGDREGIPVALMEGMACGLPVVASDISGIPELVEDGSTGFLVGPGDSVGIAYALERLASDAELRGRMGRAARERVLSDFNLRTNSRALARLLRGEPADAGEAARPPARSGAA